MNDDSTAPPAPPAPIRGPGRPPKLRVCQYCHAEKPSSAFPGKDAQACKDCRRIHPTVDPTYVPPQLRWQIPAGWRQQELLEDAEGMQQLNSTIAALTAGFQRCRCCFSVEHMRSVMGTPFCALCAVQVDSCGRCETHRSAQFFPELSGNVVPFVSREIRALFETPVALGDNGRPVEKSTTPEPDDDP